MASVTFTGAYIHNAVDLTDYQELPGAEIGADDVQGGSVRAYANGVYRAVMRSNRTTIANLHTKIMSKTVREWLEGFVGQTILYRDGRSRLFYGVFLDMNVDEIPGDLGYASGTLTIQKITKTVEV